MKWINIMKAIKAVVVLTLPLWFSACQSVQSYDGKTGYQREQSNSQQVIISYVMDGKASDALISQKLQKACNRELGKPLNTTTQVKILDQKEYANLDKTTSQNDPETTIPLGNSKTSFGLSSTPRLSNNSNPANLDMLNTKTNTLKQVTAECLK